MKAVDTNVIVRYLVADDPDQFRRANAVMGKEAVFIPTSVLLETAWVLSSRYGIDRGRIADRLRAVLGLPDVSVADPVAVDQALEWYERGLDYADALHLALSIGSGCNGFLTFDHAFARDANEIQPLKVSEPDGVA